MIFKVIGKIGEMSFEKHFDCPKKLEIAMKDIDKNKELGVFNYGYVDILAKNELIRRYEWF